MILLLGGTSETAPIATALAEAGFDVLVSTATDMPLDVGDNRGVTRRSGALDEAAMDALVLSKGIKAIVDATHPYAMAAHANARSVAEKHGLSYFRWVRPQAPTEGEFIHFADTHEDAAAIACSFGRPVLLTVGSKNLAPYAREAHRASVKIVARVLPHPSSIQAALRAGLDENKIVTGRGPFSLKQNLSLIRDFNIGVIVTKDSGAAGGVPAKIEAAQQEDCLVVVVRRPDEAAGGAFQDFLELVNAVTSSLKRGPVK